MSEKRIMFQAWKNYKMNFHLHDFKSGAVLGRMRLTCPLQDANYLFTAHLLP